MRRTTWPANSPPRNELSFSLFLWTSMHRQGKKYRGKNDKKRSVYKTEFPTVIVIEGVRVCDTGEFASFWTQIMRLRGWQWQVVVHSGFAPGRPLFRMSSMALMSAMKTSLLSLLLVWLLWLLPRPPSKVPSQEMRFSSFVYCASMSRTLLPFSS